MHLPRSRTKAPPHPLRNPEGLNCKTYCRAICEKRIALYLPRSRTKTPPHPLGIPEALNWTTYCRAVSEKRIALYPPRGRTDAPRVRLEFQAESNAPDFLQPHRRIYLFRNLPLRFHPQCFNLSPLLSTSSRSRFELGSQTNLAKTFCPRLASSGLDKKFEQAASNARLTVAPWKKVGFVGWLLCSPLPLLGGAICFFSFWTSPLADR